MHILLIAASATNKVLYLDILCLGRSQADILPGIPHATIQQWDGLSLETHYQYNELPLFPKSWRMTCVVDAVSSPEFPTLCCLWRLEVITVPQVASCKSYDRHGSTAFAHESLLECHLFLHIQTHPKGDVTIILGSMDLEGSEFPKLLLMRFHKIATTSVTNDTAVQIYNYVRAVSGKGGFELTQTSGSSGMVCPSSNSNFLLVLMEHLSSLPSAVRACKILIGKMLYVVRYQCVADDGTSNEMTIIKYGVPREGGSFQCTLCGMQMFHLVAGMSYGKMIATLLLKKWNNHWIHNGVMPVTVGAMLSELKQIQFARGIA